MTKIVYNKDINVPGDLSAQFPLLKRLLDNSEINKEFEGPEAAANISKLFFNWFGLLSLIFIVVVLMLTAWRFLLQSGPGTSAYLLVASAILGALSFGLSLTSHYVFHFQDKWLTNRFITERLRQWKFQQLLDGSFVVLSQTDPKRFDEEFTGRWAKAKFDLLEGVGTMNDFLNAEDFKLFVEPSICPPGQMAQQLREAYQVLRLNYQGKYFSYKRDRLRTLDVWTNGLAKLSLLIAGFLAFGEVILLLIREVNRESNLNWIIGASALSAALVSAAIRVIRSAKAISEESERYASKWVRMKIQAERFVRESVPSHQLECMVETERASIEELREFIRAFNKSDYLL